MEFTFAFTIAYVVGFFSGFAINTYFVFETRWSWRKLFMFPGVHAVNYAFGVVVVWIFVEYLGVSRKVAPVISAILTIPLNFLLSRALIRGRGEFNSDLQ